MFVTPAFAQATGSGGFVPHRFISPSSSYISYYVFYYNQTPTKKAKEHNLMVNA